MRIYLLVLLGLAVYSCQDTKNARGVTPTRATADRPVPPQPDSSKWLRPTRGIRGILADRQGRLWFSSADYVCMYDGHTHTYFTKEDGSPITGTVHEDPKGTVWIEDGLKLYGYDGKRFTAYALTSEAIQRSSPPVRQPIWFQKGIDRSDTRYPEPGAFRLSPAGLTFFPFPVEKAEHNQYLYYPTTKALFDHDSTLWFGTMEKVFGLHRGSFITLGRKEMGRASDPRQMGIRGLFVDSRGNLWIADNGAGIFVYDGQAVVNFTQAHHLDEGDRAGNTLHRAFSVAEDTLGNMWFGTVYSGIWKYNPHTKEFTNYTQQDGVLSDNIWTIYRTKQGTLLFAGESPGAVYTFDGQSFDRMF